MKLTLIKMERMKAGYTQKEFAELIGMHKDQYNSIENARRNPTIGTLCIICKELGMSIVEANKDFGLDIAKYGITE